MTLLRLCPLLALLPLGSTAGCCALSRMFCGPDRTEWVSIGYDRPRDTLTTFLEALRRENPTQVYFCLAPSYVRELGIDGGTMHIAYQRLLEQMPYLHLLGYVEVPAQPSATSDGGMTYEIAVEGRQLRVDLVRQSYWIVRYRDADGTQQEASRILDGDTLHGRLRLRADGYHPIDDIPVSQVDMIRPLSFEHGTSDHPLPLDRVDFLALGREWKIANIVMPR